MANRLRRNKARTRAISSRIEKGLTTKSSAPAQKPRRRKTSSPAPRSMIIVEHSCRVLRAQPGTNFGARHAERHPIENDKIGRRAGELSCGFVAAIDAFDDIAFGLEIAAESTPASARSPDDRDARLGHTTRDGRD